MKKNNILIRWIGISFILLLLFMGCLKGLYESHKAQMKTNDMLFTDMDSMQVHYIDVGQGDCTLVICDGYSLLIDAGNNSKGTAVQLYIAKQGIEKLDYVIGTHPDADHIGGLDVILYKFDCETIILPDYEKDTKTYDEVIQIMKNKNYKSILPVVGHTYTLGSAFFTIIAPNGSYGNHANDYSIGILLEHGDNRFVFTGDAEEDAEADMLRSAADISANVYKVSHHGSKTASTQAFLEAMNPEYAVISCGEGNSYGHPHAQVLDRLRIMGIAVFRTDEQGSIIAMSDGKEIVWNCSPTETWQAGEGNKSNQEEGVSSENEDKQTSVLAGVTYIVNTNTERFHNPTCASAEEIADKNKMKSVLGRDELINLGYSPCSRCKP